MNAYRYKAVSPSGAKVSGVIEAYDEFEAVAKIKESCSIVEKVEEVKGRRERIDLNEPLWVSDKVLSMVSSQFSILLRAGLPIVRTVEIIAQQTADRLMKKILTKVAGDVAAGYSLAQSFETNGKKLPLTFIETVRAGEESGTLEQCFVRLEKYYEKSYKMKAKVRAAMRYPIFLCILAVAVVAIIVNVTLPVLLNIITAGGGTLPLPTRILMGLTNFFSHWWPLLLGLVLAGLIFRRMYGQTEEGRKRFAVLALRLPATGKINLLKGCSQFANTLSTLLAAGLSLDRALTVTGRVMDNYIMGLSVSEARAGVEEGRRVGDVLSGNPWFPPLLVEMTAVGEESGSLEETLNTIGAYYDSEADQAASRALAMMEPIITVVMGAVIGFIVIALYLPMFTMYANIG